MSEAKLLSDVIIKFTEFTNFSSRIFRNNVGMGWSGKFKRKVPKAGNYFLDAGDVVISNARPIQFGLCEGSSDAIGWTQIEITRDMVGKHIAVFTAVETKSLKGKASEQQLNFINLVNESGGMSVVAKHLDDLYEMQKDYNPVA